MDPFDLGCSKYCIHCEDGIFVQVQLSDFRLLPRNNNKEGNPSDFSGREFVIV